MIVWDTETTGLPQPETAPLKSQPSIIEFAAIKLDDKLEEVDRITFLCNPRIPLPAKITEITGLTDDDVKGQPPFSHFLPKLQAFFFREGVMVAHNVAFDRSLLRFELMRLDAMTRFPWPMTHICTVEVGKTLMPGYKWPKMTELYRHLFGKDLQQTHRAMDDVMALVEIVRELSKRGAL
jgi:DNA polymerase-3 subunit alpha (Gram-positive type)